MQIFRDIFLENVFGGLFLSINCAFEKPSFFTTTTILTFLAKSSENGNCSLDSPVFDGFVLRKSSNGYCCGALSRCKMTNFAVEIYN